MVDSSRCFHDPLDRGVEAFADATLAAAYKRSTHCDRVGQQLFNTLTIHLLTSAITSLTDFLIETRDKQGRAS